MLRLGGQRDARRARLQRPELGVGVRDPLGKERHGAPRRQLRPAAREACVVAGRVAAAGAGFVRPVDRDAAERFHDQPTDRVPKERALREEARGEPSRHAQDHRIEEPVRMIENENQWLPGRDPLASLDDARGIVEADQRLSQPSKERRNPPAHAKIIRRICLRLPSRLKTPAGTRIPGPLAITTRRRRRSRRLGTRRRRRRGPLYTSEACRNPP